MAKGICAVQNESSCALRKGLGFVALTAAAVAGWLAFSGTDALSATVGEKAPAFTAATADGKTVSLADFAGKTVVLEWHNKECPFVVKHYESGNMQALQKELTAKDVVWLTVNSSADGKQGHETAEAALKTAADSAAVPTHILLDTDGTVGRAYDAKTTPHMYVIDKEGTLVYAGAIDDRASFKQEDIPGAKNYVREAVAALAEGKAVETASTKPYGCSVKY
ncbi:MAG: thioredoxin family protein [Alphaproteobacteria bacterium]|nr:thioredoxin family protein [Alphaproteobacteria bacterium]